MVIVCHSRESHILWSLNAFPSTHINTDICFSSPG